jgi:hypothetical protein
MVLKLCPFKKNVLQKAAYGKVSKNSAVKKEAKETKEQA